MGQRDPGVRVFLSYAHESPEFGETVRDLWLLLRRLGVDARLDLPAAEQPVDWSLWMMEQVREADFVLVIASPQYRLRAEGRAAPDVGRGVQFEAALIRDAFYEDQAAGRLRFLPVVLPGASVEDIPAFLGRAATTRYVLPEVSEQGVDRLFRVLTGQPWEVEPPLGDLAPRGSRSTEPSRRVGLASAHQLVLDVTLAGAVVTCRASLSGSALSEETGGLPVGVGSVWDGLSKGNPLAVADRLAQVGSQLWTLLLGASAARIEQLVDRWQLGSTLDVVVVVDEAASALPYELLRFADGRLLGTLAGVRMRRRLRGCDHDAVAPQAGPLKLLVAVAAPDESRTPAPALAVEAEMQAVLDAVSPVSETEAGQVRVLEVAGARQIGEALRDDQYHVLHLSAHGSATGVMLEDEDGAPVEVGAADLVQALRTGQRPLPLIVLSSCRSGAGGSANLASMLVRAGADRVLAMQASVTDRYATELARLFYQALAAGATVTPGQALADARRQLEEQRRAARQPGPPEYGVPMLLGVGDDTALRDADRPALPLTRRTVMPAGGTVRQLRIGELIGRRAVMREAIGVLGGDAKWVSRTGAVSGVVLTGIGGIGKTAAAGRIQSRLAAERWVPVVHVGAWSPQALASAVGQALPALRGALAAAGDDVGMLGVIGELLRQWPVLLLFDDFEQNLTEDGQQFTDASFADVFPALCAAAQRGRILVTCRYPVPGGAALLHHIAIPPLTASELRRMMLRFDGFTELDPDERRTLAATIGGHPRLVEFVDALRRRHGRAVLQTATLKLHALARAEGVDVTRPRPLDDAVAQAIVLGSRDILLDTLLAGLTELERDLLLQAAVSRTEMTVADLLTAYRHDGANSPVRDADGEAAVERLIDSTLLSRTADGDLIVLAWVAEALARHQGPTGPNRHRRAIAMRFRRLEANRGAFTDLVEIARHYAELNENTEMISFALAAAEMIARQLGELSVATFLGDVIGWAPTDDRRFLPLADREAAALMATGSLDAAYHRTLKLLAVTQKFADADPSNAQAQRDLSITHNRLGDLAQARGDLTTAATAYQADLTIAQRLADADPTNAQAQRDLSISHNRLGDLAHARGDLTTAATAYHASLTIAQRLADADPTNAQAQRDLSISHNKTGDLAQTRGDLTTAATAYHTALTIRQRLADADPTNAQAQRDLSISHGRLGDLAQARGDLTTAANAYQADLTIAQRLADADLTNAEAQRDLSISHNRLGDLARARGDLTTAATAYHASLTIAQRLADADPTNAQAQRDLSISHNRLGDLARARGDLTTAATAYHTALTIAQRLADADPTNAQAQRDLSISHNRLGDLAHARGDLTTAANAYHTALTIAQRLADADPTNAQAQRDLSISHNKTGDLAHARGDLTTAANAYHASLTIAQRLADADPTNAQAQRDLSISHNKTGDLAQTRGDLTTAATAYHTALTITQHLADNDPTNAQAQRDLAFVQERLRSLGGDEQ
ncbi:CHAT domain-containing protein [Micromonospora zingiberis]|uniref:CHAT domain-containing protein n=1 Tax=Micromonospora zingiberis TaxID=2053011 RepID=UPI0013F46711|nr:CHAT domain-containing protein [Micromonospora zingiberis]